MIPKRIIYGCEARGDANSPYLIRWTLLKFKNLKVYFHKFVRSDADELHDHPWSFISIILWRGYIEETFINPPELHTVKRINHPRFGIIDIFRQYSPLYYKDPKTLDNFPTKKRRIYPGMILFRKAGYSHRVELVSNKPAYTVVITFKYVRQWGFYTKHLWQQFEDYFIERRC